MHYERIALGGRWVLVHRGPGTDRATARVWTTTAPPLPEAEVELRLAICKTCTEFLGGFKAEQYRCLKKTGCKKLRLARPEESCALAKWVGGTVLK